MSICATSVALANGFMPKYGNFENQPVILRDRCPENKNKLNLHLPGGGGVVEREQMWNFGQWPSWFSSRAPKPVGLLLCSKVMLGPFGVLVLNWPLS